MNYNIFENEQEKAEARKHLTDLEQHPGWKVLLKAIDANIVFLTDQLKSKKDFQSLEEMSFLQDRIADLEAMKDLPQSILKEIETLPEEEETDLY